MDDLVLLGVDPNSDGNDSPTIYYNPKTDQYLVQGYKLSLEEVAQLKKLANLPEHEDAIWLPARMLQFFPGVKHDDAKV